MATATTNNTTKPTALPVLPENIPTELKALPRWVGWKYVFRAGKSKPWTKPPINVKAGGLAKSTDPATWASFDEALAAYEAGDLDGIGFVFTDDDDYFGIDLDNCFADGNLQPWTKRNGKWADGAPEPSVIASTVGSYTEISPSGTGVKIIARGSLAKSLKKDPFEMYGAGRYFCVTGHVHEHDEIVTVEKPVIERLAEVFAPAKAKSLPTKNNSDKLSELNGTNGHVTDADIIRLLENSKSADRFRALWNGEWDGLFPSQSEADQSLCNSLAWAAGQLGEQTVDALFRRSGLMRDKWDDRHSSDSTTYGQATLAKAMERGEHYDWHRRNGHDRGSGQDVGAERRRAGNFNLTDIGNAERLRHHHGQDLRFCWPWGKWLTWDGKRWRNDNVGEVQRRAMTIPRLTFREAAKIENTEKRAAIAKFSNASEKRDRINAMIALAQSEQGIPILPDQLDGNPWLFNVPNGTIDLRTGTLHPHKRGDYITKLCPVEYVEPAACDCSKFEEFLLTIMGGKAHLVSFLKRLLGYAITGLSREHVLPIFHGEGSNGKSTLLEAVMNVLGEDYSMKAASDLLIAKRHESHPTDKADLFGMRFVAAIESGENRRLNEPLIKELTGGDTIRARRMREDFWQFRPTHLVVLATNHRPVVRGEDHAIWRRLRLVPFAVTIPESEQDKKLGEKLYAEREGILRWLVDGCLEWQQDGLNPPDEVMAATKDYRDEQDQIGRFLADECIIEAAATDDERAAIGSFRAQAGPLFSRYKSWCEDTGEHPKTNNNFAKSMESRGFEKIDARHRYYLGLVIRPD